MSLTLQNFVQNDTDYIAKLNNNNLALSGAINPLLSGTTGAVGSSVSFQTVLFGLFGANIVFVGASSYRYNQISPTALNFSPGAVWKPSLGKVVILGNSASVDFTGLPSGNYSIEVDASGVPTSNATPAEPLYVITWNGSSFGTITRTAKYLFAAVDEDAVLHSNVTNTDFLNPSARLDAIEQSIILNAQQGSGTSPTAPSGGGGTVVVLTASLNIGTFAGNSYEQSVTGIITGLQQTDMVLKIVPPSKQPVGYVEGDATVTASGAGYAVTWNWGNISGAPITLQTGTYTFLVNRAG